MDVAFHLSRYRISKPGVPEKVGKFVEARKRKMLFKCMVCLAQPRHFQVVPSDSKFA